MELAIYAVDGRRVKTIMKDTREAGSHQVTWNGTDERGAAMRPGMYYARLVTPAGRLSRTLVLTK